VLHLSEAAAYNRIEAARAARRFSLLLERLEVGDLTLTAVRLLAPHITDANCNDVIASARHKGKQAIEELVASLHPRPAAMSMLRRLPGNVPPLTFAVERPLVDDAQHVETPSTAEAPRPAKPGEQCLRLRTRHRNRAR
jgi:hypothetical protein